MGAEIVLRVANTDDARFLLQGELRAIQQQLEFVENRGIIGDAIKGTYTGYLNSDGQ
jgi:hypothetical protein